MKIYNEHFIKTAEIQTEFYNEELKIGGSNANFSKHCGLKKVAAHYFQIPPGYRTSEPHAESLEEEFVYVISGEIDLWLNGKVKKMTKGDCIGFPAGTGVGHCFINNYEYSCELFVSGDRTKPDNQYHFHLDQSLEKECGDRWWKDMPTQVLGGHDGWPGEFDSSLIDNEIVVLNAFDKFTEDSFTYPGDSEEFINAVYMSRHFGMKDIAINLVRIPVGRRSSWPHAHSKEEEFVFVLEGAPFVSLNGEEYEARPFTGIDFKAGSGVAHTLINKSDDYIYYLCVGECDAKGDQIYYPEHPHRNEQVREEGWLWEEMDISLKA
ncbi:cupin domain protein [Bacteriovorax sp. BAL6_X]|uniref:cupin domain-containing protein n=1 Tax=Bacteriovorax sp. BAL6_X TaxID=1201290 RepID=UPI000386B405|nr:cupin domain-containing protein [Bacteriovorax sp. BAL6_X]EPZ52140.1 cupin domain protein [Bacteriovorax sp. BAL6_X]